MPQTNEISWTFLGNLYFIFFVLIFFQFFFYQNMKIFPLSFLSLKSHFLF